MSRKRSKQQEKGASPGASSPAINTAGPVPGFVWPVLCALVALVALLHLAAAFAPSGVNWGFHHLAFLPLPFRVLFPALMLLLLFPPVETRVGALFESAVVRVTRLSRGGKIVLGIGGLLLAALIFWTFRQTTFFLGDAMFVMRGLRTLRSAADIPQAIINAPLSGWFTWQIYQALLPKNPADAHQLAFQVFSVLLGVANLALLSRVVREIGADAQDRALAFLFLAGGGTAQMFFGYVENYTLALVAGLLFSWLAVLHFRGRAHAALPMAALGVLFVSHFGFFVMLPVAVLLLGRLVLRKKYLDAALGVGAAIAAAVALLWLSGYTLEAVRAEFAEQGEGGRHFVPFATKSTGWHAYTMFSLWHLGDLANLFMLVSPFAVPVLLLLAGPLFRAMRGGSVPLAALVLGALCVLAFAFAFNFDIGMSRDWDLVASYTSLVAVAAAFAWFWLVGDPGLRRRGMLLMGVVTLLHTIPWVLTNADSAASIDRSRMLRDDRVWGPAAIIYANEDLGNFYRDRKDFAKAVEYYEAGLRIDSTNSRRWIGIASAYDGLGDRANLFRAYRRAVETGTKSPEVYNAVLALGDQAGRLDEAFASLKAGLARDTANMPLHYFIGAGYAQFARSCEQALPYLERAAVLGPTVPQVFHALGKCYHNLGMKRQMAGAFGRYLELAPNAPDADEVRRLLAEAGGN